MKLFKTCDLCNNKLLGICITRQGICWNCKKKLPESIVSINNQIFNLTDKLDEHCDTYSFNKLKTLIKEGLSLCNLLIDYKNKKYIHFTRKNNPTKTKLQFQKNINYWLDNHYYKLEEKLDTTGSINKQIKSHEKLISTLNEWQDKFELESDDILKDFYESVYTDLFDIEYDYYFNLGEEFEDNEDTKKAIENYNLALNIYDEFSNRIKIDSNYRTDILDKLKPITNIQAN